MNMMDNREEYVNALRKINLRRRWNEYYETFIKSLIRMAYWQILQSYKIVSIIKHHHHPPYLSSPVVLAGEYNSGKSSLINALLGNEFQESGVLPTTDAITILMANDNEDTTNNDRNSADIDIVPQLG